MAGILIIGDSFVEGVGGDNGEGWAHIVSKALKRKNVSISGEGGDTTEKILARWPSQAFDFYIVQVGTNDARFRPSLGGYEIPKRKFEKNLSQIVERIKILDGGAKAFFVGLLFVDEDRTVPYKEDKIYKKFSIEQYDRVIENECSKSGATYISLRDVPKDRQYLFDGLHPSQKGHEEIAKRVLNALAPHFS